MKKFISLLTIYFVMGIVTSCGDDKKSGSTEDKASKDSNKDQPTVSDDKNPKYPEGKDLQVQTGSQTNSIEEVGKPAQQPENPVATSVKTPVLSNVEQAKEIMKKVVTLVDQYKEAEDQMDDTKAEEIIRECIKLVKQLKTLDSELTPAERKDIEQFVKFIENKLDTDAMGRMESHASRLGLSF